MLTIVLVTALSLVLAPQDDSLCSSHELPADWGSVLAFAEVCTDASRKELVLFSKEATDEKTQQLAALLIEECSLEPTLPSMRQPRLVASHSGNLDAIKLTSGKPSFLVLSATIDRCGRVSAATVIRSSGVREFDQAGKDDFAKALFRPARSVNGGFEESPLYWQVQYQPLHGE